MATHPFFNAGVAPKKKAEHPLIASSQPGGWMERAGRIGSNIMGLPGALAKGIYDEYANTAKFLGRYMDGETAMQLRGDEEIHDNGDVYRNGELVGNMLLDKDALVRSSTNVADLAPVSAIGSGAARLAKGQKAVDPNTLNVFIGPKGANKAEKKLLEEAKEMSAKLAKEGMSAQDIRILTQQKTGWAHNPAMDVWQMELSDLDAKLKPDFVDTLSSKELTDKAVNGQLDIRAPNAIDHPLLFERYPQLAETSVQPLGPYSPGFKAMRGGGDYSFAGNGGRPNPRIRVWGDPSSDLATPDNRAKSVLLHELQHNIQDIEGWPNGSNPGMFYNPDMTTDSVKNMIKTTQEMNPPDVLEIPAVKEEMEWWRKKYLPARRREDFVGDSPEMAASRAAQYMYMSTAGEAQARNVQRRLTQEATDAEITDIMRAADEASGRSASYSPDELYPPAPNPARQRPFEHTQDISYGPQHNVPQRLKTGIGSIKTGDAMSASMPERTNPLFDGDPYKYVEPGPPVLRDKKTGKVVSGPHENWREMDLPEGQFWGKSQTPREEQLMAAKAAAREQVKMGDYHPFFDVEKRYDADYSKYPARPETATEMGPKTAKAKAKYAELTSDPQLEARLTAAYDNAKADSGAVDWYKMGQLEDAFIQEFGPDEGRRLFQQRFADPMAATTGGMDPETNLLATARANYQSAQGLPATAEASHQYPAGIGGGKYGLHGNMQVYDRLMGPEGKGLTLENPKRMNFSSNFLGNPKAVTLDEQMGDLMGHGTTAFNGPAYGPYEGAVRKVADDLGVDPRQFQEIAWAGHKKTKDKTYIPKPMIQIFNEAVARTSKITGLSQEEVVKMFMHAKGPLYAAPAAIIGGAAAMPGMSEDEVQF